MVETRQPTERTGARKECCDVRRLMNEQHEAAARVIHRSLAHWYQSRLGQGERFGTDHSPFKIFPDVYGALDPGEAVSAVDRESGDLIGVAFVHPRPSHIAVGIVAVAPEAQGRGVARAMLDPVMERARQSERPVRLISSVLNLDSFSLYSRLGFVPHTLYQDMCLTVPARGIAQFAPPESTRVRRLTDPCDASRMARFEFALQGLQRERDYSFFLHNRVGDWKVWGHESATGALEGFLVASLHPACVMLGPGVAKDEITVAGLLWRALDEMRGMSPVFLVPSHARSLVRQCYQWGARNIELHAAQTTGRESIGRGILLPTFLPETG